MNHNGYVNNNGNNVNNNNNGVDAALNLNLSSNQWSPAGTVCSDRTGNETGGDVGGEDASLETDYESEVVSFMKNKGTLNTIKYLCKDSNFTNSIHVRENDATFGSSII